MNNAAELAAGSNPLFPEAQAPGPVLYADGELWLYNPNNYAPYTIKSEPEGELFATTTAYVKPGTKVTSGTYGTATAKFAYWKINGVSQRDDWGRALDAVSLAMPEEAVEIVAVTATGDSDGDGIEDRLELYWYGNLAQGATSDTDGDGKTFAQELAAGTNPLMAEGHEEGPVVYVDGGLWQYNPYDIQPYTLKSDPEGELFETTTTYVRKGTQVTSGAYGTATGFAYWKVNGVVQRDEWGRASDSVSFAMPGEAVELTAVKVTGDSDGDGIADNVELYWYGNLDEDPESDSDGDGKTFAQELAAETNPLMAENHEDGPILYADTTDQELNLQIYEQAQGALVDGAFVQLFTSPIVSNNATSVTFGRAREGSQGEGSQIWPVVGDVNGDGLWDLIVVCEVATNVFVNVGTKGNPRFATAGAPSLCNVDLMMNSTAKLAGMTLDVEPVGALSATTNGAAMLVSDVDGRIWYYTRAAEDVGPYQLPATNYQLLHKVWGGSYAGFAEGLMLAAVDWEDDGDLDCLCGTAEGKLMLLRDPKVGRPTNLRAEAGVDNVLLSWDPNGGSRVRGYKVYRSVADAESYGVRGAPALPAWRDFPEVVADYDYKVSAVSRFYTAGNSAPSESESVATDPVRAELGKVSFRWSDAAGFVGDEIVVDLGVRNSLNLAGEGLSLAIGYDASVLRPVRVVPSGLTTNVTFTQSAAKDVWQVTATGGEIAAGGGTFFSFVFKGLAETNATAVSLSSVTMKSAGGASVPAILPTANALIKIEGSVRPPDDPNVVVPYSRGDLDGNGRLTKEDKQLLAELMNGKGGKGKKPTAEQLRAGDYNGNGRLDQDDYQLLKDDFKARGIK